MAGSRRESIGTIITRLRGLLKSGAMKYEERPLWYDVVTAKPPKPIPASKEIKKILYPEDFVRAHFYKTYADPTPVSLSDEGRQSIPQRFIDKYLELHREGAVPSTSLFEETAKQLQSEGVQLMTHEEKKAARSSKKPGQETSTDQPSYIQSKQKMSELVNSLFDENKK